MWTIDADVGSAACTDNDRTAHAVAVALFRPSKRHTTARYTATWLASAVLTRLLPKTSKSETIRLRMTISYLA